MTREQHCGTVAVAGLTNAGKSTIVNHLVGQDVSVVHRKSQTTRASIRGIFTRKHAQVVLTDLAGWHTTHLPHAAVWGIDRQLAIADVILMVVDASVLPNLSLDSVRWELLEKMLERLRRIPPQTPLLVALNKIDSVTPREALLPIVNTLDQRLTIHAGRPATQCLLLSAKTGSGMDDLATTLLGLMPQRSWLFPEQTTSDLPDPLLAAERTRAVCMELLHEEIPYRLTVTPQTWQDQSDGSLHISQEIALLHQRHKGTVIGRQGAMLSAIRQRAQRDLIRWLGRCVQLRLHVRHHKQALDGVWTRVGGRAAMLSLDITGQDNNRWPDEPATPTPTRRRSPRTHQTPHQTPQSPSKRVRKKDQRSRKRS